MHLLAVVFSFLISFRPNVFGHPCPFHLLPLASLILSQNIPKRNISLTSISFLQEQVKGFQSLGFKPEVQTLAHFQDDYGIEGDEDGHVDDPDDEDEDEDEDGDYDDDEEDDK